MPFCKKAVLELKQRKGSEDPDVAAMLNILAVIYRYLPCSMYYIIEVRGSLYVIAAHLFSQGAGEDEGGHQVSPRDSGHQREAFWSGSPCGCCHLQQPECPPREDRGLQDCRTVLQEGPGDQTKGVCVCVCRVSLIPYPLSSSPHQLLGATHPDVAKQFSNLAILCQHLGKYDEVMVTNMTR